jgi:hypothetical protein
MTNGLIVRVLLNILYGELIFRDFQVLPWKHRLPVHCTGVPVNSKNLEKYTVVLMVPGTVVLQ